MDAIWAPFWSFKDDVCLKAHLHGGNCFPNTINCRLFALGLYKFVRDYHGGLINGAVEGGGWGGGGAYIWVGL